MQIKELKKITVTEYAKRKKVTRQCVLKWIRLGKVSAKKFGNYYLIEIEK